jgi:hypothetical protein
MISPKLEAWMLTKLDEVDALISTAREERDIPQLIATLYRLARETERVDMALSAYAMQDGGMTRGAAARALGITTGAASSRSGNAKANADLRAALYGDA